MAACVSGLPKGNIGYNTDSLILDDKRFFKKKRWSADDNVIPEDKRWSSDINKMPEDKIWSADDCFGLINVIPLDHRLANAILDDPNEKCSADLIPYDKRFSKKKRCSADVGIPEDKRFVKKMRLSADIKEILGDTVGSTDFNKIPGDGIWIGEIDEILDGSFEEEIRDVFDVSIKQSFRELKEENAVVFDSQEGMPGDFNCQNVLTIWPKFRESPELRDMYPHIKKPRDIGELIKKNLPAYATDMIDEEPSVEDVGFVTISLSRDWLAKSIHKMLKYGIDTWAPKLPVETVSLHYPSLDGLDYVGSFRQLFIRDALFRMLVFSKVNVVRKQVLSMEAASSLKIWDEGILRRSFSVKNLGDKENVVIEGKETLPFILSEREFQKSSLDLRYLRSEIEEEKPDWIVYITPTFQQEYVEMCFTAAKHENWIKTDMAGKWDPSFRNEYPVATYAGYETCSTEHEELANLLKQVRDHCEVVVAQGDDSQILGYSAEAVFLGVLMYTFLKSHRLADCTFSFAEMVGEEGNTFIYLLHSLVEIDRITSDSREDIDGLKNASELRLEKYQGWRGSEECILEFHLLEFNDVLEESCLSLLPHLMCKYLYDLTKKYNSYNDFVRKAGPVAETSRLLLCEATAVVMRKCFQVLLITPDTEYLYRAMLLELLRYTKPPMDVYAPVTVEPLDALYAPVTVEPLDDLVKRNSVLYKAAQWRVLFSEDFRRSFGKLTCYRLKKLVLNLLLRLSTGWRPENRSVGLSRENCSKIFKQFEVEGLYIICTIDIIKDIQYVQVIKVWDILPYEEISKLTKQLENIYSAYTEDCITRCTEKLFQGNLEVPRCWAASQEFIRFRHLVNDKVSEDSSGGRNFVENLKLRESLLLMKFYSLSYEVVCHLLSGNEVGVEPDRKEQQMAEKEQKAKTPLDPKIVDRFITPFVSDARYPLRKSRFEVFSIRPYITTDCEFEDFNMFGLIAISDKYGLRLDGGTHLFEPDFPYVALFKHEWCDPIKIHQNQVVYLGNPGSHHLSVPFSSCIHICMQLYVTSEEKDDCFELCNRKFKLDLKKFWDGKSDSKCGRLNVKGEDGRTMVHYMLFKDAVDVDIALDVTFKADPDRKVYGYIDAFYGGGFSYDCDREEQAKYKATLVESFLTVGPISLKRSVLSVPKNASLNIKAYLVDVDTNEVILSDCYEFPQGRCHGTLHGLEDRASLDMKVVWKY